ncbi:MAG: energy-coupling factor ABC transporter substrate-binding protein [Propionibacteriaceae bacterium]|nr:energy-coupling factor ABC transporter substrate-binding protein [Propionibacteriaceae bacterium]
MPEHSGNKSGGVGVTIAIVAAIVVLFAVSFALGHHFVADTEFGGTDAAATEAIEESGYQPWFDSLFSPASGEVESGLFALQAALGAGALGFVLGWFRAKNKFGVKTD